jgi:hypothetical protein
VEDVAPAPAEARQLEVRHELELPGDDTTYWCSVHKLPKAVARNKHHVVQVGQRNAECDFLSAETAESVTMCQKHNLAVHMLPWRELNSAEKNECLLG